MLVDVGGRRLHLVCIGAGEPTVFFEASAFGVSSLSSATVREQVAAHTRVCSYDRMGMGWSDAGPSVVTVGTLARDLAVLQDRAELHAPFLLVASSIGGLTVDMFARQYSERVSGLVFLDAASGGSLERLEPRFALRGFVPVVTLAARFGMIRLIDPFKIPTDSDESRRSRSITYGARPIGTIGAIVRGLPESLNEFRKAPPLPNDVRLAGTERVGQQSPHAARPRRLRPPEGNTARSSQATRGGVDARLMADGAKERASHRRQPAEGRHGRGAQDAGGHSSQLSRTDT